MGLHLYRPMNRFLVILVGPGADVGEEATTNATGDHCGIVGVGRQHSRGALLVGVLDHLEQRLGLALPVDGPAGVERLVAAVLGIDL